MPQSLRRAPGISAWNLEDDIWEDGSTESATAVAAAALLLESSDEACSVPRLTASDAQLLESSTGSVGMAESVGEAVGATLLDSNRSDRHAASPSVSRSGSFTAWQEVWFQGPKPQEAGAAPPTASHWDGGAVTAAALEAAAAAEAVASEARVSSLRGHPAVDTERGCGPVTSSRASMCFVFAGILIAVAHQCGHDGGTPAVAPSALALPLLPVNLDRRGPAPLSGVSGSGEADSPDGGLTDQGGVRWSDGRPGLRWPTFSASGSAASGSADPSTRAGRSFLQSHTGVDRGATPAAQAAARGAASQAAALVDDATVAWLADLRFGDGMPDEVYARAERRFNATIREPIRIAITGQVCLCLCTPSH